MDDYNKAMEIRTRQKAVGAAVLLALGIVLLPLLLDGDARERRRYVYDPPPMPEIAPRSVSAAEVAREMDAMAALSAAEMPQPVAADPDDTRAVLDANGLPIGWTLQLATFRDAENALRLRAELRRATYQSYILREGEVHRVFVGPTLDRVRLERLAQEIASEFDLEGMVIRYSLEDDKTLVGG